MDKDLEKEYLEDLDHYDEGMGIHSTSYKKCKERLIRLAKIDSASPSKAVNSLNKLWGAFICSTRTNEKYVEDNPFVRKYVEDYDIIKQALLKQLSGSQYTNIAIDEAVMPSETLRKLRELRAKPFNWETLIKVLDEVEQALQRLDKYEQILGSGRLTDRNYKNTTLDLDSCKPYLRLGQLEDIYEGKQ